MRKANKKELEKKIDGMLKDKKGGVDIVQFLSSYQDASGLKVCQAVTSEDPAYKEVK